MKTVIFTAALQFKYMYVTVNNGRGTLPTVCGKEEIRIIFRPLRVDWMIDDLHRLKRNIEGRFRFL